MFSEKKTEWAVKRIEKKIVSSDYKQKIDIQIPHI